MTVRDDRPLSPEEALKEIVGHAYNLLTQGELPTQRRQPSAQAIYDLASAELVRLRDETPKADERCPESSQEGARCIYQAGHDGQHFAKDSFSYYSWLRDEGKGEPVTVCGRCGMKEVRPHGDGFKCRVCGSQFTTPPIGLRDDRATASEADDERGSVVPGRNAGELALTNDGVGADHYCEGADASENPAKRVSSSVSLAADVRCTPCSTAGIASAAVCRAEMPEGCAAFPDLTVQDLCAQHMSSLEPVGDCLVVAVYDPAVFRLVTGREDP